MLSLFPDINELLLVAFVFICLLATPSFLHAAENTFVPSIALSEEFNDNISLTTDSKRSDFITTVSPGLAINSKTERSGLGLLAGLNWLTYARNSDLSSAGYSLQGKGNH